MSDQQPSTTELVATIDGSCPWTPTGQHNWLPWLRISSDQALPSASFVTRCLACGRKEQWDV